MSDKLRQLFEPYDGVNVKPLGGEFVVFVPYGDHDPIVVGSVGLANKIAKAIESAYDSGIYTRDDR
jgi:hypothetical protein